MNLSDIKQLIQITISGYLVRVYNLNPIGVAFDVGHRTIKLSGNDCIGLTEQTFFKGYNDDLNVECKTVLDIGASIGDTAICFVLNGAKKVYAIEPMGSYTFLCKNIEQNSMSDMIIPLKVGVGESCKTIRAKAGKTRSSDKLEEGDDFAVKVMSLKGMIEELQIENGAVVKMDCEGCEFEAVLSSETATLRHFGAFLMEIHGEPESIVQKFMASGFKMKKTELGSYLFRRENQ